jgi:hypothetical protein
MPTASVLVQPGRAVLALCSTRLGRIAGAVAIVEQYWRELSLQISPKCVMVCFPGSAELAQLNFCRITSR